MFFFKKIQKPIILLLLLFVLVSRLLNIILFHLLQDSYGYVQPLTWSDHLYLSNLETCEGVQSFIDYELELKGLFVFVEA